MDYKIFTSEREIEEIKIKLNNLVNFINSEDYYKLPENKKNLINNLRAATEMYLNSLSSLAYTDDNAFTSPNLFMPFLFSMFMNGSSFGSTNCIKDELNTKENKEETFNIPKQE